MAQQRSRIHCHRHCSRQCCCCCPHCIDHTNRCRRDDDRERRGQRDVVARTGLQSTTLPMTAVQARRAQPKSRGCSPSLQGRSPTCACSIALRHHPEPLLPLLPLPCCQCCPFLLPTAAAPSPLPLLSCCCCCCCCHVMSPTLPPPPLPPQHTFCCSGSGSPSHEGAASQRLQGRSTSHEGAAQVTMAQPESAREHPEPCPAAV
jgi:hypothetical protein